MFSQPNLPLYFFLLVTPEKKVILVRSEKGWTFPGFTGHGTYAHDIYVKTSLSEYVDRLSLKEKEFLHLQNNFQVASSVYDCHLIGFSAEIVLREHRQDNIRLASLDWLGRDDMHEHVRRLLHVEKLQSRLR